MENLNLQSQNQGNQFDIFNYKNLGSVRCYVSQDGQKWFCMTDVCNILGIKNNRDAMSRLRPDGVGSTDVIDSMGRYQQATFVNEGNLMELIFTSRKPEAKEFRAWVCNEVLPSLMNKGYYAMKEISPAMVLVEMSKQLVEHERRLTTTEQNVSDNTVRIDDVYRIQRQLIETGYISVKSFIVYHNIDMNTIDPAHLGRVCSNICNSQGIPTGTEPSDRWNFVNTYPYSVVLEAFQKITFNQVNN